MHDSRTGVRREQATAVGQKIVEAGNCVEFEPNGAFIEDMESGQKMALYLVGGMYTLKAWVRNVDASVFRGKEPGKPTDGDPETCKANT